MINVNICYFICKIFQKLAVMSDKIIWLPNLACKEVVFYFS